MIFLIENCLLGHKFDLIYYFIQISVKIYVLKDICYKLQIYLVKGYIMKEIHVYWGCLTRRYIHTERWVKCQLMAAKVIIAPVSKPIIQDRNGCVTLTNGLNIYGYIF